MRMDTVFIEGLEVLAHVGVTEEERRRRQRISIDVGMLLSLARAGRSDSVEDSIDYAAVSVQVRKLAENRSYRLAEALAQALADGILKQFHPRQVCVRVRKFSVPGAVSVGVEIRRSRKRSRVRENLTLVGTSRTKWGFPKAGPQ